MIFQPVFLSQMIQSSSLRKKFGRQSRFKKWFFGHYHDNRNVTKDELLLWEQIIKIS